MSVGKIVPGRQNSNNNPKFQGQQNPKIKILIMKVKKLVFKKVTTFLYLWLNDVKCSKFLFFIDFIATQKEKDQIRRKLDSKKKNI